MAQKTKRDWWLAGVALLAEAGPQGLTIEALCQRLEVTKGSFYHHFAGYDEFKVSLLAFYEAEGTLNIIEQLAELPTPQTKLRGLMDIVVEASLTYRNYPEVAIRAWALQDEAVKAVQVRVDGRRLAYVQALCQEITGDPHRAQMMARHLYAILVGSEQMQPPLHGEELRALFDEYFRLYAIDLVIA